MGIGIESVGYLLIVAALVAVVARRLRVSYTVALVVAGIGLGFFPLSGQFMLTRELIFDILLPPLIFEAALSIRWDELRRDLILVSTLATIGLLLSVGVVFFGLTRLTHWPSEAALVFAALISATDPVSVIALMKEAGAKGRIRTLLEAESLFNDGMAAVVFVIAVAAAQGAGLSAPAAAGQFAWIAGGGALVGAAIAFLGMLIAGRTDDHLVELVITTVIAFGSFLLAERFGASGVLATLTAGLLIANFGRISELTEKGRESIESFWEFAAFVSNSIVFLLMGILCVRYVGGAIDENGRAMLPGLLTGVFAAIALVLLGRAASVYGVSALFISSRWKASLREQHVLVWGGLRGALALALVLSLPANFQEREDLTVVTFSVVAFSVIVQGLSVKPLLRPHVPGTQ